MADRLIRLDGDVTAERAFDALRQVAPSLVDHLGEGYPEGLAVETRKRTAADAGAGWEVTTDTTAYVVSWDWYSVYRQRTVRRGAVLVDVEYGGLAPDGFAGCRRTVARMPADDDELGALMLLAERDNFPHAWRCEEY